MFRYLPLYVPAPAAGDTIVANDTIHAHDADLVSLEQFSAVFGGNRIIDIAGLNRTATVARNSRVVDVASKSRSFDA